MSPVVMYTTAFCPYCVRAKRLLDSKGVGYEEIAVDREPQRRLEMMEKSQQRTVPQIWIADEHIGGCDELYALERQGVLNNKLGLVS